MAMDFPGQPTVGQVFTVGSISYVWNGYAWAGGGSQPLPATTIVSDTPPANPRAGQTWWESDTGILFMNYDDGNGPAQWVQINATIPSVPNDGNEYVWVNNAWRLVGQIVTPTAGTAFVNVPVPAYAKLLHITGSVFMPGTSFAAMRLSGDGTTFAAGATDYGVGGPYHDLNPPAFSSTAVAGQAQIRLTLNGDNINFPHTFMAFMNVVRNTTAQNFLLKAYGHALIGTDHETIWYSGNLGPAFAQLRLGAIQLIAGNSTFNAGSSFHLRWM
jgi:hypothetical protein